MTNETVKGKEINKDKFRKIIKIIRNLDLKQIDNFFYNLKWIDSEAEKGRALPFWRIKKIKKDKKFAEDFIDTLFQETPKKEFLKEFNKLNNKLILEKKLK